MNPRSQNQSLETRVAAVRRFLFLIPVLLVALLGTGCSFLGIFSNPDRPDPRTRVTWITLTVLPDVNDNWPVAVEYVRVREEPLMDVLLRMGANEWFEAAGDAFRLSQPEAVFDQWEIVPGTSIGPIEVRRRGRFGGVLFCGLRGTPPPPVRVAERGRVQIVVDNSGCTVSRGP